jgi:hypothetical protein
MKFLSFDKYSALNENSNTWYATFKAQGEIIDKKEDVSKDELDKIAYYFKEFFSLKDVSIGQVSNNIKYKNIFFGISATQNIYGDTHIYTYYYRPGSGNLDPGWIGSLTIIHGSYRMPATNMYMQFMSPAQFLECVEMDMFYASSWSDDINKKHIEDIHIKMYELSLKSPRKHKIVGKKYGI